MALDFPSSPTNGQVYGGYIYDSTKLAWVVNPQAQAPAFMSDTAPTSPVSGTEWYNTTDGNLYVYYTDGSSNQWVQVKTQSAYASTLGTRVDAIENTRPNTNYIINGDFAINQRAFTSTTTSNAYGFDRWLLGTVGGTCTYSAQTFTPGAAPVAGYEAQNFARTVTTGQSAASDYALLAQKIEDVRTLAGQTATISFWAKAASGTPKIAVELDQNFGSGGSPSSSVQTYGGQVTLSTSWARYSITVSVPSISGKTIGTAANSSLLSLNLWMSGGSTYNARNGTLGIQSNTFDFWGVQVEAGSIATPFHTATGTKQGELAACQRYYIRFTDAAGITLCFGTGLGTTSARFIMSLPVELRIIPTAIDYSTISGFAIGDGTTTYSITAFSLSSSGKASVRFDATGATGLTQYRMYFVNIAAAGYIGFNAEL